MKFKISSKIFDQYPKLHVGVAVLDKADNSKATSAVVELLRQSELEVRKKYQDTPRSDIPEIKCWRQAYKNFGAKEYTSSVEALLKRVLKGDEIWNINDLVNLYNAMSLKYLLPFGGEDIDQFKGDLELTVAQGGEQCKLLGDDEPSTVKPGEIIYQDQSGPVCRRWNWREADRTKLTKDTTHVILLCEDLCSSGPDLCQQAIGKTFELAQKLLKAQGRVAILNKDHQEIEL